MTASIFADVELAPRDPILGLNEAFNADTRANKVNLGVGVYYDDNGKIPLLAAVRQAEEARVATHPPRGYQPIEGGGAYNTAVQDMLFGKGSTLAAEKRLITAQALGGTGALKIGADLLHRLNPHATVYISDPSWENHRALFEAAGFGVATYPYFDSATRGVDFPAMRNTLDRLSPGSIVVLHACCHNPTGADLTPEEWDQVISILNEKDHIPFLDMAYQGFGDGITEDALSLRKLADANRPFLVSSSFSKSFSLYGERVGALSVITSSAEEATRVLSQLKRTIRTNYSNPPTHGGAVVAAVLSTPTLRQEWEQELATMRERIKAMRQGLLQGLQAEGVTADFSFVTHQRGMFSYTGLSEAQVSRLRDEFAVYAVSTGRVCMAALNQQNLPRVCKAIAAVLRG